MFTQENLTTEERERQKAARRRFREIVKQRWQEEQLKNLSKKAIKKISKKRYGYEVELIGGTDLEFSQNGKFLRIGD